MSDLADAELRRLRGIEAAAQVLLLEWAETPGYTGYPLSTGLTRLRQALSGMTDAEWHAAAADRRRTGGLTWTSASG